MGYMQQKQNRAISLGWWGLIVEWRKWLSQSQHVLRKKHTSLNELHQESLDQDEFSKAMVQGLRCEYGRTWWIGGSNLCAWHTFAV